MTLCAFNDSILFMPSFWFGAFYTVAIVTAPFDVYQKPKMSRVQRVCGFLKLLLAR